MRKWVVLFLFLTVSAAPAGAQDLERHFERSFAETPATVALRVTRGVIEVVNAPAGGPLRFVVDLRVQDPAAKEKGGILERLAPDLLAPFKRDVDAAFKSMEPRYKAGSDRVEMSLRDSRPVVFDYDPALQMVIVVKVEVPVGVKLEVRSVAAGVMIGDYRGALDLRGEGGSFFVESVDGDFFGKTTTGSITVGEVGGSADLRTTSGSILTGKLRGRAKLRSSNGGIEVRRSMSLGKGCETPRMISTRCGSTRTTPKSFSVSRIPCPRTSTCAPPPARSRSTSTATCRSRSTRPRGFSARCAPAVWSP
jgi:hypothetical protein